VTYRDIKPGQYTADLLAPADGYVIEFRNKRIIQISRMAGAPNDKGAGVRIHRKHGERVSKGEPVLTIHADKKSKLEDAIKSAQQDLPIVVEGMLLERVPSFKEI
jgi:AMP phosphorylase